MYKNKCILKSFYSSKGNYPRSHDQIKTALSSCEMLVYKVLAFGTGNTSVNHVATQTNISESRLVDRNYNQRLGLKRSISLRVSLSAHISGGGWRERVKKIHLHCMIRPGDWSPWSGWRCALLKCKVNSSSPELDNFKADWLLRLRVLLHFSSFRSPLLAAGQSASHKALLPLAHDFMGVLDVSLEHVCSNS